MMDATNSAITTGSRVKLSKGCKARGWTKGALAVVKSVEPLGAEHSHMVRVAIQFLNTFSAGKTVCVYARHVNRLSDAEVSLNDGSPENQIRIVRHR